MKGYIIRILCILICVSNFNVLVLAQNHAKKKVAVYMAGSTSNNVYKKVIGAKLVNVITESGEYAAVERTADFLAVLSAENDYQTSGEVRDSQIATLGQKFGVRYVVVAEVSELFDEYFIAARLINVETGLVERAFDINGPAESMEQLVSLSHKIAKGLLNVREIPESDGISTDPKNMSLCAVKDGKVVFISPLQWQNMKELEKITFNKKGVCIVDNGEIFVVAMIDSGYGDQNKARLLKAPKLYQLKIMYRNLNSLNTALKIFGSEPLNNETRNDVGYISSDYGTNDACGFRLKMCDGTYREDKWNDSWSGNLIRTVYNINEIF